jgi:membrane associated rhomboid family serine protease
MIPLRSTERTYSAATATAALIVMNIVIFLYQVTMDSGSLAPFVERWGIVPDQISGHLYTLFTSMFLHGGWLHLLGNMMFLWVFGRNVEDLIGSSSYLLFYVVCGLAAGIMQVVTNPYSRVPTIGASAMASAANSGRCARSTLCE